MVERIKAPLASAVPLFDSNLGLKKSLQEFARPESKWLRRAREDNIHCRQIPVRGDFLQKSVGVIT